MTKIVGSKVRIKPFAIDWEWEAMPEDIVKAVLSDMYKVMKPLAKRMTIDGHKIKKIDFEFDYERVGETKIRAIVEFKETKK